VRFLVLFLKNVVLETPVQTIPEYFATAPDLLNEMIGALSGKPHRPFSSGTSKPGHMSPARSHYEDCKALIRILLFRRADRISLE
jgi:hypothetical protein